MKQKLVCHPDLKEVAEAAIRGMGKEDEIDIILNPSVPDKNMAYLITVGYEPILQDPRPTS
jgi:hypothetical protein